MLVIFSIYNRISLLPYFLRYYSSIGATRFECALYQGEKSRFYDDILKFKSKYDLHVRMSTNCPVHKFRGLSEVPALNAIRKEFASKFSWYCIADLDEFHFFNGKTLSQVVEEAEEKGYDAIHGVFFDRISADGRFLKVKGRLDKTFPLVCHLTSLAGLRSDKVVLAKSHIEIFSGHHDVLSAKVWRNGAEVHHFKWTEGADEVVSNTLIRIRKQRLPYVPHMGRLWSMTRHRIDVSDPRLSLRKASPIGI
jgi:hypothetical protein